MTASQAEIEKRLAVVEPDVELLLAEQVSAHTLRIFIDHPAGVDLDLCERVTGHLRDLLQETGLEVSSPGPQRPLTKPGHFRRFSGRRARLRTHGDATSERQTFTGEIVAADDEAVTLAADTGVVRIAYADIKRSNLLEG